MASRVHEFFRINMSEFLGPKNREDPKNIIDEVKKNIRVMQVAGNDRMRLASYQLKNVAHVWFTQCI